MLGNHSVKERTLPYHVHSPGFDPQYHDTTKTNTKKQSWTQLCMAATRIVTKKYRQCPSADKYGDKIQVTHSHEINEG